MKTERDMFAEWYKSEYPLDYEHYVNEQDIGLFTKLYLRCFVSWKASAQREGYKLVPLEMHWNKADDLASAEWDKHKALFCSDNRDMTALQVEEFRLRWCKNKAHQIMNEYKAMIGAAP